MQFEVSLVIDDYDLRNQTVCLDYTQLTVATQLIVADAENDIPFSTIDAHASKECSEGYDWDCYYWPSGTSGEAVLDIYDGSGSDCSTNDLPELSITFNSSGIGRLYLFTVVVNAWLDETLSLECSNFIYNTEESVGLPDLGTDGLYSCAKGGTEDDASDVSCTSSGTISVASAGLSTTTYWIYLTEVDLTNAPDYHDCHIQFRSGSALTDPFVDFTLLVTASQAMVDPEIVEDGLDIEWQRYKFVDGMGQVNYLFYVKLVNSNSISFGYNDLCTLRLYPPEFISGGGGACLTFGKGRVIDETSCYLLDSDNQFEDNHDDCTSFGDSPDECVNDFAVSVTGVNPTNCDDLQVEVEFNFSGMNDYIDLDALRLQLDFEGTGVAITNVSLGDAVDCVAGNSAVCSSGYSGDCFEYASNSFSMCFQQLSNGPLRIYRHEPITIDLTSGSGCVDGVVFRKAEISLAGGDFETCIPAETGRTSDNFPLCVYYLAGEIKDDEDAIITDVDIHVENTSSPATYEDDVVSDCGGYANCVPGYDDYVITPHKSNDMLNGVSTFDLVLINKHILGLEPLPTLENKIAANANVTVGVAANITIFDVASIRKVILGIETNFNPGTPHDESWRFYPSSTTLVDAGYNVMPTFDESIDVSVSAMGNDPVDLDFTGIKLGDVNGNHVSNDCKPAARPASETANAGTYPVALRAPAARSGEYLTVPLVSTDKSPLHALQAAFRFDPEVVEFVGVSRGEVEGVDAGCFGLTEVSAGLIRFVWLSPDMDQQRWNPGQVLCNLTFRAKRKIRGAGPVLTLDNNVLAAQGYTVDNRIYDLRLDDNAGTDSRSESPESLFTAQVRPNPTTGAVILRAEMAQATAKVRIAVFSAFGQRLLYQEADLPKGRSDIPLPEVAGLAPGVYTWRVWTVAGKQEGQLIKQ